MAEYGFTIRETLVASINLPTSDWKHKFVAVNSAGKVTAPTAGAAVAGILEVGGSAGDACTITVFGLTKVRMGAATGGGAAIATAGSGYAAAVGSGDITGGVTWGVVASGYLVEALINAVPGIGAVG